jgi:hypothetical protein
LKNEQWQAFYYWIVASFHFSNQLLANSDCSLLEPVDLKRPLADFIPLF